MSFDIEKIREDFPALQGVHYLDSACMSLRPVQVISKVNEYYNEYPACAGRSYHSFGKRVTEEVYDARKTIKDFIGAKKDNEIIFTKNATEAINVVASGVGLVKGDVVLTSDKEHNSNLLPWLRLEAKGVLHDVVKTDENNCFIMDNLQKAFSKYGGKVKICAFGLTSNLDGVSIPAKEIIDFCHNHGALVLLDGAQAVAHQETNVKKLDVDFFAFSGHKMCGPCGIGVLYGKENLLKYFPPLVIGGETVVNSTYTGFELDALPMRLEAGLQNYAGIIGLGEACRYLKRVGFKNIQKHELLLNRLITEELSEMIGDQIELIGPDDAALRSGIFNIIINDVNSHEAAMMLDQSNSVMVRSGQHCVHSWFNARKKDISIRASLFFYNNEDDARAFVEGVKDIVKNFS